MPRAPRRFPEELDVDLAGLSAAAEPWVSRLDVNDQRVQAAPDARNIWFYQTAGLLDRPSRYDGRVARYGTRHLLQLVAIRTLQAQGLSLAQVQSAFVGITNGELQQIVANALGSKWFDDTNSSLPGPAQDSSSDVPVVSSTSLVAVELVPGVVVTINSQIHADVAHTVNVLRRALSEHNAQLRARKGELS